jgi:hypothetical protein
MQGYQQGAALQAQQDQADFLQTQRARTLAEQKREDDLRAADRAVATTKQVEFEETVPGGEAPFDGVGPTQNQTVKRAETRNRNQDEVFRDMAENRRKAGDIKGYFEYEDKANKLVFTRNINLFSQVAADAGNKSTFEVAKEIGNIFDSDPMNGGTKSIQDLGNGGVRITLYNKDTGKTSTKDFTGENAKQQMLQSFQPYFQPEMYAKLQQETALARARIAEEIAKNPYQTVAPGASALDKRTGKIVYTNPTDRTVIGTDENGNNIYGKPQGGSGTGAGAGSGSGKGKGSGPVDPAAAALSHFDSVAQHSEDKLPIDQAAQARDYVSRLATTNPSMPPAMVSRVAIAAAKDPNKLVPAINPDTGLIDTVFDDGQNGKITFNTGIGSATKPGNIKPEQLQQMTTTLLASKSPQEKAELIAAANDSKARGAIEARMRKQASDVIAQRTQGLNEQQAAVVTQQINDALETKLGYLGNNLDMIAKYGEKPAPKKPEGGSKINQPGGLPNFSGLSGKQLDAAVNADARAQVDANRGRAQEVEKARKAAAVDPELLKLDQERAALLRKGDAVGANSKIAEYNKLKNERYGL